MLTFNDTTGTFLLYTHDAAAAEAAGLTLSTTIRGPAGEKVYFTADQGRQPSFNPYAALEFFEEADDRARTRLQPFIGDYRASWNDGLVGWQDDLVVMAGDPIAQIAFEYLDLPTDQPYVGKYQHQERGPQDAREET